MTPAFCSARPASRIDSRCAGPTLLWVSSVRSLSCLSTTASVKLGHADEDLLELVVVGERILARLLVGRDHAPHDVGVILGELLAHVEDAPGVGVGIADRTACAPSLTSCCAIIGSRPAQASTSPRMSAVPPSACCCTSTGVMSLSVSPAASSARTSEDVRIGAAHHRDLLALEVLDLGDLAVLGGDQRGPFRPRIDVDRLDRIAVDLGDQRRGARGRAEVDRAGVEELQRIAGRDGLHPARPRCRPWRTPSRGSPCP